MKNLKSALTLLTLILVLGACGVVPSAYRGDFRTEDQQSLLTLEATKGVFTTPEEILEASASRMKFKNLMKGEPGIYVRENPIKKGLMDVFWVHPDLSTMEEAGGLLWFETEVYYSLFDGSKKEKVGSIRLLHSGAGTVMLEPATELWQIGWPAGPTEILLTRVPEE